MNDDAAKSIFTDDSEIFSSVFAKQTKFLPTLIFIITNLFVLSFHSIAYADAISWDGGGDGVSWSSANNWSGDVSPGAADDVTIDANVTVNLDASTTINSLVLGNASATTAPVLNFNYNAVGGAPLNIDDGDLTVYSGATVTHTMGTSVVIGSISINVLTGNANVSGNVNANNKGYRYSCGTGAGATNTGSGLGAGYGGYGGTNSNYGFWYTTYVGGVAYGSLTNPSDLGSGGGNCSASSGGYGGGSIKLLVAGMLANNGSISANGKAGNTDTSSCGGGGGSGGSVWLSVGVLSGSGVISANGGNGGNGSSSDAGGGGGGRIAVYYASDTSSISYQAYGALGPDNATDGAAGTIYLKPSGLDATLVINNNGVIPQAACTGIISSNLTLNSFLVNDNAISVSSPVTSVTNLTVSNFGKVAFLSGAIVTVNTITTQSGGNLDVGTGSSVIYSNLNWSSSGVLTDNGGTFALFSSGGDLVVPITSTFNANVPRTFNSITVNGTISHYANASSKVYYIDLTTSGNFLINAGGEINVSGKGYEKDSGPGAGNNAGGGGYGGDGGDSGRSGANGGVAYGSFTNPSDLGSGGGSYINVGGAGGGVVKLSVAGEFENNGSIFANGVDRQSSDPVGSGAGGSILLDVNVLGGNGVISANGGNVHVSNQYGGGGGGGRIAVYYVSDTSSISYQAYGGPNVNYALEKGAAGTIYIKPAGASAMFIARNQDNVTQKTAKTGAISSSMEFGTVLVSGTIINITSSAFYSQNVTVDNAGRIVFTNGVNANIVNLTAQNSGDVWVDVGCSLSYTTLNWSNYGILTDNGGTFLPFSSSGDLIIPANSTYNANVPRTFNSITVNGTISHSANASTKLYYIDLTSNSNLTINSSGAINVDYKGFAGSEGPGQGGDSDQSSGAGYAGNGGDGSSGKLGGVAYGSSIWPTDLGSGGGHGASDRGILGGPGGGAIKLSVATTLANYGVISANGQNGTPGINAVSSAGSGGSIWLTTQTLLGDGVVHSSGGSSGCYFTACGGGGSGGRLAIYYAVNSSTITTEAIGGVGPGAATDGAVGTIYTEQINKAPNAPTALSPIAIVTGGLTSNLAPTFNFTLSDDDVSDTVRYRIQIDDIYDFSSPVVSYISALQTQGSASFTVGQAAGGGSYTVGNESQVLSSGSYYLRVATIDDSGDVSSYNTANSGGVAFIVDTVAPNVSSVGSSASNGTYKAGDFIAISVSFNDNVTVTGSPLISLNSGGTATYATGSGSSTLTFYYTVLTNENSADLDYANTSALSLNNGTIKDAAGNDAILTLATPGAAGSLSNAKAIVIDALAPGAPVITLPSAGSTISTLPTISGTAEANTLIDIFCNGALLGTTSANGIGAWTFTVVSELGEGAVQFRAQARDANGNVGALSSGISVIVQKEQEPVDPEPEPTPVETETYSITGVIHLDSIDASELSGVAANLYEGQTLISRVESNGHGVFSFTGIEAGSYTVSFYKSGYEFLDENNEVITQIPVVITDANISNINATATRVSSSIKWGAWNSYLDMLNVLELNNAGENKEHVVVQIFSADGVELNSLDFNISSNSQRDVIINDIPSFSKNAVGLIKVTSETENVTGRMSLYKRSADGASFDFSFNQTLEVGANTKTFVGFNGMQPSRLESERENVVAQWLTIANLTSAQKRFWVRTYSIDGALLMTRLISVPGFGRRDVDGNAITALASRVGYHELEPELEDTLYFAYLMRYGTNAPLNVAPSGYSFVLSLQSTYADTKHLYVPISSPLNSINWLELINTSNAAQNINIKYYDGAGQETNETGLRIKAHAQAHINASEYLPLYGAGFSHIEATTSDAIVAQSIVYAYLEDGSIDAVYLRRAMEPTSMMLSGTYNLYLSMTNWLTVTNITSNPVTMTLNLSASTGAESYTETLRLKPNTTSVYPLHLQSKYGLSPNTYGTITLNSSSKGAILSDVLRAKPSSISGWDFVSSNWVK